MAEVKTYYGAEPSDQTPGTTWIAEDGAKKQRSTSGAWTDMGNVDLDNGGSVKRAGDSMDGALEGAHGLAPLDSPPFTTNATLDDKDLADKPWVTTQLKNLHDLITQQIKSATEGDAASLGIFDYIAFGFGTFTAPSNGNGYEIPLPYYKLGNGTQAQISEVVLLDVTPLDVGGEISGDIADILKIHCEVDKTTLKANVYASHTRSGWGNVYGTGNYIIICAKNPS